MALILLEKFCQHSKISLTFDNVYRIFVVSLNLALKFLLDINYKNIFYSKISSIDISAFSKIELEIYKHLDFNIYVKEEEFNRTAEEPMAIANTKTKMLCLPLFLRK